MFAIILSFKVQIFWEGRLQKLGQSSTYNLTLLSNVKKKIGRWAELPFRNFLNFTMEIYLGTHENQPLLLCYFPQSFLPITKLYCRSPAKPDKITIYRVDGQWRILLIVHAVFFVGAFISCSLLVLLINMYLFILVTYNYNAKIKNAPMCIIILAFM